jgi:hypothetical protein
MMSELPYIGCALTIVDPGPVSQPRNTIYSPRRYRNGELRLMKVWVTRVEEIAEWGRRGHPGDTSVRWRAGRREGEVVLIEEGTGWVRGHGPMAQASLRATRKLVGA